MQRCFGQGLQYVAICCLFCPYFLIFSNRTVNWHKYGQTTMIYRVLLGKNQWVFHIYSQYLRCLQGIYPMKSYQNPEFFCIVSISLIPCGFQELCYRSILKHRDLHESCIAHALQAKTSPPVAVGNISSFFGPGDPGDQLGRCKRGVTSYLFGQHPMGPWVFSAHVPSKMVNVGPHPGMIQWLL